MTRATKTQQAESLELLRATLKPGDTLYTVLRHRASSGMSRAIDVYKLGQQRSDQGRDNGRIQKQWLSFHAARAAGFRFSEKYDAVDMGGAGMDMGFHLVYSLSRVVFAEGFDCIGEGCPSNDHVNERERNYTPGRRHSDPGYALNHEWL